MEWLAQPFPCTALPCLDSDQVGLAGWGWGEGPCSQVRRPAVSSPDLVGEMGPAWGGHVAGTTLLLAPVGEQGLGMGPGGARPPPLLALGGWPGLSTACEPRRGPGPCPCPSLSPPSRPGDLWGFAQCGWVPGPLSPTGWGPGAPFPGVLVPYACPPPWSPVSLPPTLARAGLRLRPGLSCSLCPGLFPGTCFPQVGVFRPCCPTVCHSCLGMVWHPGRRQGLLVASSAQLWGHSPVGTGTPPGRGLGGDGRQDCLLLVGPLQG